MSSTTNRQENEIAKVLVVIDTESIQKKYSYPVDSIPIEIDKDCWYVFSTRKFNIENKKAALHSISIRAEKEDHIQLSGISLDTNSSNAIIINQIHKENSEHNILTPFTTYCNTMLTIAQNPYTQDVNEIVIADQNCIWFTSSVSKYGTEKIKISFSMYYLDFDGNQQAYYGQFYFFVDVHVYKNSIRNGIHKNA